MTEESVVPDSKTGTEGNAEKHNVVETYILEGATRDELNELRHLQVGLARIREAMSELQSNANVHKRKYGFVPDDIREALSASRGSYRSIHRRINSILYEEDKLKSLFKEEE